MARITTDGFRMDVDWDDHATHVSSPDLRATWGGLQVWVNGRCATSVRGSDSGPRDEVYGSAYPLAEWIAYNWWSLTTEQRPSAVEQDRWSWRYVGEQDWLRRHNLRGANEGQAWPDLTLVREGDLFAVVWNADPADEVDTVQFQTGGRQFLRAQQVVAELSRLVESVLSRLAARGVDSPLAKEWTRIAQTDADPGEAEFCRAAARLGLDPYDTPDGIADRLPDLAESLGPDLLEDFLDSADLGHLEGAYDWVVGARSSLHSVRAAPLGELREALGGVVVDAEQPWSTGYNAARIIRNHWGLSATEPTTTDKWVAVADRDADPCGLTGFGATTEDDACRLVVPTAMQMLPRGFAAARALGRALLQRPGSEFLLTSAHGKQEAAARTFAAELLAPAEGIELMLLKLQQRNDAAYDAVASVFNVSPLVVKFQEQNQLD